MGLEDIPLELVLLAIAILLPIIGGVLVAQVVSGNISWYQEINKPDWAPPNWLFGPVWIVLYTLIGLASFLAVRGGISEDKLIETAIALLVYTSNLALNFSWSLIFFGMQDIKTALADILLIDATAVGTAYLFYRVSVISGVLLVPYLVWLVIATALNYSIVQLNPEEPASRKSKKIK